MQIITSRDNLHKFQIWFSEKDKKYITNLSSAEFVKRVVKAKVIIIEC